MNWKKMTITRDATHHLLDGIPAYSQRFREVLKFHEPGLAPVCSEEGAYHIHPDGSPAYTRRFVRTFGFYEGLSAVIASDGWHHIDTSGKDAYSMRYAWCGNVQVGRCAVRDGEGKYYHITSGGHPAYEQRYRYAGDFRDGIAVVQEEHGLSTHIDADGKPLHGRFFRDLDVFHKGFARARDDAGWMHVDRSGHAIYTRRFAAVEPFYNGQARVERMDGGLEIIDESGRCMAELRKPLQSDFAALSADMVGFWKTQTIAAAVDLGIFETLPGSSVSIAERCSLWPDRTERLMRALSELSLVTHSEGLWQASARGEYLQKDHPLTLADAAREYGTFFPELWKMLPEALRQKGGFNSRDIFAEVARDPSRHKAHHRMLQSYARHDYEDVPQTLALQGNETLVDAAGGLGVLASLLLKQYPGLQIVLFDRPDVIEQAKSIHALSSNLRFQAGDIFDPWPIQADAVLLSRVLHDWDDDHALRILQHARAALSPGGRIFVVEMLLEEGSVSGSLCDLHLLTATGGQERSLAEYANLLEKSGFVFSERRRLPSLVSILVGVAL